MTQEDLANALYVTPQAVSQWERDLTIPNTDKLSKLAAVLHTSVNVLTDDAGTNQDWTMLDSLFSTEHMYSRMTVFAEVEHLTETQKALRFMREAHEGQTRKPAFYSNTPVAYIAHPLLMACHAHALGIKEDAILATILLHDVLEDCCVKLQEIPCSESVKEAVRLLTWVEDGSPNRNALNKRYYDTISQNRIACLVKIIDRCNNISTMASAFSRKKVIKYIKETETYVMPLVEHARKTIPEYVDAIFVLKYHMRSILESVKAMIMLENAR
jgi:GTP pyrophosphokinase